MSTQKQLMYMEFAKKFFIKKGRPPTYREMAEHFGKALSTVYETVNQIADFKKWQKSSIRCVLCGQLIREGNRAREVIKNKRKDKDEKDKRSTGDEK